ncbi:uncharacterized protein NPIL_190651 [Nephila pilipes]|uniref:Uncharacterized protein n=1 Tax=Nephila pilipes TaxID=299642 RepID=A0A8X6R157_NEPPI|nr:uncharacterized protein NPIL_93641 [Nephila pilipes]GFU61152.1 uncharacterized protein NPIL_190651 [Nephila pilipes]
MCPSGNMARQIPLIVILSLSMEFILAARILESTNFGIIGQNSDNFPEGEKFDANGAKMFPGSSGEKVRNILNESVAKIDEREREITPENNQRTDPAADVNDVTASGVKISTNIPPEYINTNLTSTVSIAQHDKNDGAPELLNMNDNHKNGILSIWIRKYDEVSSTMLPNINSELISVMPYEAKQTVEHNSILEPTSTTVSSVADSTSERVTRSSDTNRHSGTTESIKVSKPKINIIREEDVMSESVVKNIIDPKLTENADQESNFPKMTSIEDKWLDLEKTFRFYTDSVMKKALPKFLRIHSQLNISSQCNGALLQMVSGLRKFKSWAVKSKYI